MRLIEEEVSRINFISLEIRPDTYMTLELHSDKRVYSSYWHTDLGPSSFLQAAFSRFKFENPTAILATPTSLDSVDVSQLLGEAQKNPDFFDKNYVFMRLDDEPLSFAWQYAPGPDGKIEPIAGLVCPFEDGGESIWGLVDSSATGSQYLLEYSDIFLRYFKSLK